MRLLGRLLLLLLLVVAATFGYPHLRALWQAPTGLPRLVRELDLSVQRATVYYLSSDAWLTFPVIGQAQRIRVLTHAGVSAEAVPALMPERDLDYALIYELLDGNHRLLYRAQYTHETRVAPPLLKDGVPVPRYLYADGNLAVAAGQSFQLQLDDLPQAAYLRLRVQSLAPPLANVAVRVYHEEQQTEERAAILWTRLSQHRREQLAEDVIYPPELLLERERLHLLDRVWKPIGPMGIEPPQGTLFGVKDADLVPEAVRPAGLYVSAERLGVLPIRQAGKFLVGFRPLAGTAERVRLELRQFTERFDQPQVSELDLPGDGSRVMQTLTPGLVVVRASLPGVIELYAAEDPDHSALPEPGKLRAYGVRPQAPARFSLVPDAAARTALRLDVRAYGAGTTLPPIQRIQAEYRLYDVAGGLVRAGELTAQVQPSAFDRVTATQPIADLSDPASFFFRLPPGVARVEVASGQALLVSAYTRPPDLPHRTRVPMDYYPWRGDDAEQSAWFMLRSPAVGQSAAAGQPTSVMLHTQSRPPDRDPEVLAGRYNWEALDPQMSARGARILVPVVDADRLRPTGLPTYFQPLKPGTQTVVVTAPGADRQLRPELVYLREQPDPFQLQMSIDGSSARYRLAGRRGGLQLPAMAPGKHVVRLDAGTPGQWLMNYSYPGAGGLIRRIAYRLGETPLQFQVEKRAADSQLLGARFYSSGSAGVPTTVRVRIKSSQAFTGPTAAWTHRDRRYLIAPSAADARVGYVLDQQHERISQGQPILIGLGNDVPDGPVTVEFALDSGAAGYLVFYQVLPGEYEWARGFREQAEP